MAWIGGSHLQNLVILSLRSNQFSRSLSSNLCYLSFLQILDFSHNKISGAVLKCLHKLITMAEKESSNSIIVHEFNVAEYNSWRSMMEYLDYVLFVWKGTGSEYKNILGLVKIIDLSSNKLSGKIPERVASLIGLISLNLSRNCINGPIPASIGQLTLLNSLDLSHNQLTGKIPEGVSQLGSLGVLDLSNNNLSGKIPSNTQLQSFNASAFKGNPNLCGMPFPNKCPGEERAQVPDTVPDTVPDPTKIEPWLKVFTSA